MKHTTYAILAAAAFPLALAACGLSPEIPTANDLAAARAGGKTYEAYAKSMTQAEAAWAKRAEDPNQIRKAIEGWEAVYAIDPNDRHALQRLALAHYYLGNYYTPSEIEKEKVHFKGHGYGVAAIQLNDAVRDAMAKGMTLEEAIAAHATAGDVPGLYWMAVNLGRALENKGIATRAANAPKLKAVMETVYKLGPTYYWGGVHRFFGVYYIKAPAQSDPLAQSGREFKRATEVGKDNLENYVLWAEYRAKAAQDREEFEKLLRQVIDSKPENDPAALKLDNAEARKRAKKLLEEIDEHF